MDPLENKEKILTGKKYYIKPINSSKANEMTSYYHYSGVGFKKAKVNLGVFLNSNKKLVGVLQWGCSCQDNIRLDRYVSNTISKDDYLELNRFSMANSEEKNSESQAISLGIKWIKNFLPNVRLLVSYAGRKEGNYGYIYQATNWEYLGFFISDGFWTLDGKEVHSLTVWDKYTRYGDRNKGFIEGVCDLYKDVRKTFTKQFIYITRLDKHLIPTTEPMRYPKPTNEFLIKTRENIYKKNNEVFTNYIKETKEEPNYFDNGPETLFSRRTLIRRGELAVPKTNRVGQYNMRGDLEQIFDSPALAAHDEFLLSGIRKSIATEKIYKDKYFRTYNQSETSEHIDVPILAIIDEIPFVNMSEMARYLNVSRQCVFEAKKRLSKIINKASVEWLEVSDGKN